jgi:hypothetical protein
MAQIQITTTAKYITFIANDLSTDLGFVKVLRLKNSVERLILNTDNVQMVVQNHTVPFNFSHELNANGYRKIDTVNGVAPVSLVDLYDKLVTALDS